MRAQTPAIRMHSLAYARGLRIEEFSPGLRVWTIRRIADGSGAEPVAFGVPHSLLKAKIIELGTA